MSVGNEKSNVKILIVEDEVLIAADLESRLKRLGYTIVGKATSGEQALELVEQHQPDLVMMDIVLQGDMDGIDAAEVILDKWGIPVIFLTAYADTDRLERAKLTYPFGYLLKPFQDRDLKITTEMALYVAKVDAERRIAQEQLKLFMDNLPGVAFIKDGRGTNIYSNDMYYEVAGLKREDIAGKTYDEYLPPDVADVFRKEDDSVISKNEGIEIESVFPTEDGNTYWITKKFPIIGNKNQKLIGGISIDITDRKKFEDALRASELKFRSLAENVPGLVLRYKLNPDGSDELLYISKAVEDLFEVSQEEAIKNNKLLWDRIHADDLENYTETIRVSAENISIWEQEHRLQLPGGRVKWLHTRGVPVQQDDRSVVWDTIALDITDRQHAEEALRESKERYRLISEATTDYIYSSVIHSDYSSSLEWVGGAFTDITGYTIEEINAMSKGWLSVLHQEDYQNILDDEDLPEKMHKGKWESEYRIITKHGDIRWLYDRVIQINIQDDENIHWIGGVRDITDRKRAEVAIITEKELNKKIIDSSPAYIVLLSPDGKVLKINKAMLSSLDYSEKMVLGKDYLNTFIPEEERPKLLKLFTEHATEPTLSVSSNHILTKNGEKKLVEWHGTPFLAADGTLEGYLGIGIDITERKLAEDKAKKSENKFRSMMEAMIEPAYICKQDYQIEYMNPAMKEKVGHDDGPCYKIIHGLENKCDWCVFHKVKYGESVKYEVVSPRDGRTYTISNSPIVNQDGSVSKLTIFRDTTERKQIERDLQRKIEQLNHVAATIPGTLYQLRLNTDGSLDFLYMSEGVQDMFGVSPEEALNDSDSIMSRVHEDDQDKVRNAIALSAKTMDKYTVEHRIYGKHGEIRWLRATSIPISQQDDSIIWNGVALDITERKRIENELRVSEERYRKAQSIGHVGSWEYNIQTTQFWGSDEAKRIYGFNPDSELFSTEEVEKCIPERERVHQALIDLIERGNEYDLEFDIITNDKNELKRIISKAELEKDENEQPLKITGVEPPYTILTKTVSKFGIRTVRNVFSNLLPISFIFSGFFSIHTHGKISTQFLDLGERTMQITYQLSSHCTLCRPPQ